MEIEIKFKINQPVYFYNEENFKDLIKYDEISGYTFCTKELENVSGGNVKQILYDGKEINYLVVSYDAYRTEQHEYYLRESQLFDDAVACKQAKIKFLIDNFIELASSMKNFQNYNLE